MSSEVRQLLTGLKMPALFLGWVASWFVLPAAGLELLHFGPLGFLLTGMTAMFGPPIAWIVLRGSTSGPRTTYLSPFPLYAVAVAFASLGAAQFVARPQDTTWTIWAVTASLFGAIAFATSRSNPKHHND